MSDAGPAVEHDRGSSTLRQVFRERRIALRTMDVPLRIATASTIAGLLGAAVLIWLRGAAAPQVALGVSAGAQVTLSLPLFVATLVLLSVGFGLLVSGALFARLVVAIVGLICLTALIGWSTGILGIGGYSVPLPGWASWATRIVLGLVWVVALLTVLFRRGRHGDAGEDRGLRIAVMIVVATLFGSYFLLLWVASPNINGLTLFPQSVNLLMKDVGFLATPMLMIAAVDFGEWGELSAQRLAGVPAMRQATGRSRRRAFVVPAVLACAALVYGFFFEGGTPVERLWIVAQSVFLLGIVLAILLAVGRVRPTSGAVWPRTLGFAALFGVCALVTWGGGPSVAALSGAFAVPPQPPVSAQGNYTPTASVRSITGLNGFTALVPVGWGTQADTATNVDRITNVFPDRTSVVMLALTVGPGTTMGQLVSAAQATSIGAPTRDGLWQKQMVTPNGGGQGTIWLQANGGAEGVFYGAATGKSAHSTLVTLEAIVRTYRPSRQPPATLASVLASNGTAAESDAASQRHDDVTQSLRAGFAALTAVLALLALLVFGRRWPPMWRLAVLAYAAVGAISLVASAGSIGRVFFGPSTTCPVLTVGGLLAATGITGLVALAVASRSQSGWAQRLPEAAAGILGTVIVLGILYQLYRIALTAAEIPQWAAILILVAVGWDITMSGETMTNLSSRTFPRSTRVVAFYGYILVLAATMVYFSGQLSLATGRAITEPFFDPESITQTALIRIGFAVLLLLFLLRVSHRSSQNALPTGSPAARNE
jgi:hypothetical protein